MIARFSLPSFMVMIHQLELMLGVLLAVIWLNSCSLAFMLTARSLLLEPNTQRAVYLDRYLYVTLSWTFFCL